MDVRRQAQDNPMADMPPAARHAVNGGNGGGMLSKVLAIVLLVTALAALAWFGMRAFHKVTADAGVKGKQYQALFLTNGQVYFGKLSKVDNSYVKLTDIYYLQVQQTVQPKDSSSNNQNPQVSLAKLGGELHGPEDVMYVSRSQVLFWENLKDDGKVTKAIKDYKAQGNK
jgi:hypothetical protein